MYFVVQAGFLLEGVEVVVAAGSHREMDHFCHHHLQPRLEPIEPSPGAPRFWVAHLGNGLYQARRAEEPLESPTSQPRALAQLANHLHLWVAEHCLNRIMIHAGVVAWGPRVLLLPGRSLAGKSTLVEALCRHGGTYWSDDLAVVHPQGRTTPYALPLSLRRGVNVVLPQLGDGQATAVAVLFSQFQPGGTNRLQALSPAAGLRQLLGHCPALRTYPQRVLPIAAQLAHRVTFHQLQRGEAEGVVARVCSLLSTSSNVSR